MIRPLRFDAGPPDSPPDPPEPDEGGHACLDCGCQCAPHEWVCWRCGAVQACPGCESDLDAGCPRSCPERALDDDADAYLDRCRD